MRTLFTAAFGVVALAAAVAAPVPKAVKKPSAEQKLLGKWQLTESQANGIARQNQYTFNIVFTADGVMELRYEYANGRPPSTYVGTYKVVDGDKVDYTINDRGYRKSEVLVIDKLTDDEVRWTDPDQKKEAYQRVREEKK